MRAESSTSRLQGYSAAALALALAAWTWQVWKSYLPNGLGDSIFLLRDIEPVVSHFTVKTWWVDLAGACILTFAALCIGAWILERLHIEAPGEVSDNLEHAFFSIGAGYSALILAAASLGFIASFRPGPLRGLLIAFALVAVPRAPRE